jgi:hypothetical protein
MRVSSPLLLAFCLAAGSLVTLGVACGGSTSSTASDGRSDASTDRGTPSDAATDAPEDAASHLIFEADTSKIVVTSKGGLPWPAPDGSACKSYELTYTLVLPSRELSWSLCDSSSVAPYPYEYQSGTKTLSESEFAPVSSALHALRRATEMQCGADRPFEAIAFTTPRGVATYYDAFFCNDIDPKQYVTGFNQVFDALSSLAK